MDRIRKSWITTGITVLGIIIVLIIVLVVKHNETKGEKCYLDSTIVKKEYSLTFKTDSIFDGGISYYAVFINITNNETETQTYTFKGPYYKTDRKIKVTFGTLSGNGFSIAPGDTDSYMLACPYSDMTDPKKCILHFKLNGYSYNLHTCLESYENK